MNMSSKTVIFYFIETAYNANVEAVPRHTCVVQRGSTVQAT
jgi:hypothetical protein